jgi:RNA polymerase sigma-70 factor, ECF subfamily
VKADSAFERFYMNEARGVFTAVYLMCRDRALAEDSTQEAFARALERWDRLDQQPWAAGWAMSTALNVARRSLRRRRAWPIAGQDPESRRIRGSLDRGAPASPAPT